MLVIYLLKFSIKVLSSMLHHTMDFLNPGLSKVFDVNYRRLKTVVFTGPDDIACDVEIFKDWWLHLILRNSHASKCWTLKFSLSQAKKTLVSVV